MLIFYSPFKIYGEYNLPYVINNGSHAVALGSNIFINEFVFINILSVPKTPYAIYYDYKYDNDCTNVAKIAHNYYYSN
jgi:hypothetical protein